MRPLLTTRRQVLLEYLHRLNQKYRHDETNDQRSFTRNRIRHELIPYLQRDYNQDVIQALIRLSQIAAESQSELRKIAAQLLDDCLISQTEASVKLSTIGLEGTSHHMRRECFVVLWQRQGWPLQSMGFVHWQELAQLALGSQVSSSLNLPGNIEARRLDDELRLTRT